MPSKTIHLKALGFLIFAILFSVNDIEYACKCGVPTPDVAYSRVDVVFEGRVESVWPKLIFRNDKDVPYGLFQTYQFQIFRKWKDSIKGNSIEIVSMGAGCDSVFTPGETYMVYASRNKDRNNQFTSSFCDRTGTASEAMEDYAFLGTGQIVSDSSIRFTP